MNISQAKEQICNAMKAYFTTDEYGNFVLPPQAQRPVFLMGPPGIGKTDIMHQIADELGVALVSYSMTHHTRQSALGLPKIVERRFGGETFTVTEYTMSEIIASVYETIEAGGADRGILFLDEINCVSETLTPTMLQFLQYKTFGTHKVPDGWIVVTAGNPPEFNRSAREFDIVTWDRLKRIDIEPDYQAWKEYALRHGVHASILTYLDIRKENFYRVEETASGRRFVTARGWVDLSDMIGLYELQGIKVDELLIAQYLQDKEIASDFAVYYDLFNKYRSDYQVDTILSGSASEEIRERARAAAFDERLSLLGLILDGVSREFKKIIDTEDVVSELLPLLKDVKGGASLSAKLEEEKALLDRSAKRGILSTDKRTRILRIIDFLERHVKEESDFAAIKSEYDEIVSGMRAEAQTAGEHLSHIFEFAEEVWLDGQELLILVTELTVNPHAARFIARYGCDAYYRHNRELMFYERKVEIIRELEQL